MAKQGGSKRTKKIKTNLRERAKLYLALIHCEAIAYTVADTLL